MVYRAHLLQVNQLAEPQLVAVKTLKGEVFGGNAFIIRLGVSFDANCTPSIVMPFMANGSLLSYLKTNRSSLIISDAADEKQVRLSLCTSNVCVIVIYTAPHIPEALNEDVL